MIEETESWQSNQSDVSIGKFDILATYAYAQALLTD